MKVVYGAMLPALALFSIFGTAASQNRTATNATHVPPTTGGRGDVKPPLGGGAIAGVVVGCVGLACMAAFFAQKAKRRNHERHGAVSAAVPISQLRSKSTSNEAEEQRPASLQLQMEQDGHVRHSNIYSTVPGGRDRVEVNNSIGDASRPGRQDTSSRTNLVTVDSDLEISVARVDKQTSPKKVMFESSSIRKTPQPVSPRRSSPHFILPKNKPILARKHSLDAKQHQAPDNKGNGHQHVNSFSRSLLGNAEILFGSPSATQRLELANKHSPNDSVSNISTARSISAASGTAAMAELLKGLKYSPEATVVLEDPDRPAQQVVTVQPLPAAQTSRGPAELSAGQDPPGEGQFAEVMIANTGWTSVDDYRPSSGVSIPLLTSSRQSTADSGKSQRSLSPRPMSGQKSLRHQLQGSASLSSKQPAHAQHTDTALQLEPIW